MLSHSVTAAIAPAAPLERLLLRLRRTLCAALRLLAALVPSIEPYALLELLHLSLHELA
ncbi:MAG TPA: hypothetical protein VEZ11_14640 [Thermoanaerobaculia bacterium]|nr:hypothetical protein [Thermoanaerobaculia bacterium]